MARTKLTAGRVRDFSLQDGQQQSFLWDTDTQWLAVRATSGAKVFVFQSRLGGKSLRMKIGDVTAWDIDKAREEARRLQTLIDQGTDPRQDKAEKLAATKAKRKEAKRQDATLQDAWDTYLDDRRLHWSERHLFDHQNLARLGGTPAKRGNRKTTPGPLAPLMPLKLKELTPSRIRAWLQSESAIRATQTRLAFGALRTFANWCNDRDAYRGILDMNAFTARMGRQELPKKSAKDDVLQREQLPSWFQAVGALSSPVISAYLQTLLLTGARREEIAQLQWGEVDFKWKSLTIRDKVEGERTIPLTPYVAALLGPLPRRNEWVFSSPTSKTGRLQEPRIAHNRALRAAGLPHLTLHGLRRSFGTLSEWCELPAGVVAQIMGHKPSAIAEKHYRRRPLDLLRQWHTRLEAWILAQAGLSQPAEGDTGLRVVGK